MIAAEPRRRRPREDVLEAKCAEFRANVGMALITAVKDAESRGLCRKTIARRCGRQSLNGMLNGKENLTLDTLARFSHAVQIPLGVVVDPPKPKPPEARPPEAVIPHTIHAHITMAVIPEIRRKSGARLRGATIKQILSILVETRDRWIRSRDIAKLADLHGTLVREALPAIHKAGLVKIERRPQTGLPRGSALCRYAVNYEAIRALPTIDRQENS